MPDMNIKDYMLLGAFIFCLAIGGYALELKTHLDLKTAQFDAFKARTEAAADAQKLKNLEEKAKRDEITQKLTEENVKLQSDIASKYADYRRLRNTKAGSGTMSAVPATPQSSESGQEQACIAGAVEGIEEKLLGILEQGEAGIAEAMTFEDWTDVQQKVE